MNAYLEEMARSLRQTPAFQNLPAINNRQAVWDALNGTLLQLRMPLFHKYLGKPIPKDAAYDVAIRSGLTILQAFAATAATRQIIVRFTGGRTQAVSFQPRPSNANWTADHLLQPGPLLDPDQDPLTAGGGMPQVRTSDMLFWPTRLPGSMQPARSKWMRCPMAPRHSSSSRPMKGRPCAWPSGRTTCPLLPHRTSLSLRA